MVSSLMMSLEDICNIDRTGAGKYLVVKVLRRWV